MRWLSLLATGLITGTFGAILAAPVADWVATYRQVSNFEGGRLYLVALVFVPLGFVTGLGIGLTFSSQGSGGFGGWAKSLALAIAVTAGLIGLVGGLVFAVSEHAPSIDGKKLMLEMEVRLPAAQVPKEIAGGLYMGRRNARGVSFRLTEAKAGKADGRPVVPGSVALYHTSADRLLSLAYSGENGETLPTQYFAVPLPARPRSEHRDWSSWVVPNSRMDAGRAPEAGPCEVRFRVQPIPDKN